MFRNQPVIIGFNPHTHAGCDNTEVEAKEPNKVSIHTPTQGVTIRVLKWFTSKVFQSTHPRRVWRYFEIILVIVREFQSTHPRRVWHHSFHNRLFEIDVSIHTPTQGVTQDKHLQLNYGIVSIHTPTQGVTSQKYIYHISWGFNPHTHAGCDIACVNSTALQGRFQSTHPRRVWRNSESLRQRNSVSIHTPTQGVTYSTLNNYLTGRSFNPHTHAGCDSIWQIRYWLL